MSVNVEDYVVAINKELIETKRLVLKLSQLLTERLLNPAELDALTKGAWVNAKPDIRLTWNTAMTGDEFVSLMVASGGNRLGRVLEIGPGYGRVLTTVLAGAAEFESYLGVDISAHNVQFLGEKFADDRKRFILADFLKDPVPGQFDTIYSSAVFLHLYPSVEPALEKCLKLLAPGGRVCFDVPVGDLSYIHPDYKLFVREYSDTELREMVTRAGFRSCDIQLEKEFAPRTRGWFVSAAK